MPLPGIKKDNIIFHINEPVHAITVLIIYESTLYALMESSFWLDTITLG